MALSATKLLKSVAGLVTEFYAVLSSSGAADAGSIPALNDKGVLDPSLLNGTTTSLGADSAGKVPLLGASGQLDESMMPTGIGADTAAIVASEALSAGNYVNVWSDGGVFKVRKADATTVGKHAHGFVLAAVAKDAVATVYFEGSNTEVTGQAPGDVYLSTTAGLGQATPPAGSGNAVQPIGIAVSATCVNFQYNRPIILA